MTSPETIKKLEKRYGVKITRDIIYYPFPWNADPKEDFHIYTMDGCCWDKVVGYRSLVATLARDKVSLRRLAGLDYLVKKEALV